MAGRSKPDAARPSGDHRAPFHRLSYVSPAMAGRMIVFFSPSKLVAVSVNSSLPPPFAWTFRRRGWCGRHPDPAF